jgi:hypothetical protein
MDNAFFETVQTDYKEQHEAAGPMIIYGYKNENSGAFKSL